MIMSSEDKEEMSHMCLDKKTYRVLHYKLYRRKLNLKVTFLVLNLMYSSMVLVLNQSELYLRSY